MCAEIKLLNTNTNQYGNMKWILWNDVSKINNRQVKNKKWNMKTEKWNIKEKYWKMKNLKNQSIEVFYKKYINEELIWVKYHKNLTKPYMCPIFAFLMSRTVNRAARSKKAFNSIQLKENFTKNPSKLK
jgi:hypothetical protein